MSDFISDLTGGRYKRKEEKDDLPKYNGIDLNDKYDVYIQFDNDKPICIFKDVNNTDSTEFQLTNSGDENSYIIFEDKDTGKKLKIYCKSK